MGALYINFYPTLIMFLLKDHFIFPSESQAIYVWLWIGLSMPEESDEWRWTDNSFPNYTNWKKGQPNDIKNFSNKCAVVKFMIYSLM